MGTWQDGQINKGTWELKGAGKYDGEFERGTPVGEGRFEFLNGIAQEGEYAVVKAEGEEEEATEEGEAAPPKVTWKGRPIVSF